MQQVLEHYLTEDCCRQRQKALRSAAPEHSLILISLPEHVTYFTDLQFNLVSNSPRSLSFLLIEPDGKSFLVADNHATRRQPEPFVDEYQIVRYYTHQDPVPDRRRAVQEHCVRLLRTLRFDAIATDLVALPGWLFREISPRQVHDLSETIRQMRRRKDPDELALIQRSARAIEAGLQWAREKVRPGMSELEVYREIESVCTEVIGAPVVVYGDFASGPRTWIDRGGPPTRRRIEPGDLLLLDFSVVVGGYRADFTNTLCIGEPSRQQEELMELCLKAMAAGEEQLRAGAVGKNVWQAVNDVLEAASPAYRLPHHAGHGLGLEHPEPPVFGLASDDVLAENDVVTLEPGVYVEGIAGIRIEHNYRITADGFERISRHHIGLR